MECYHLYSFFSFVSCSYRMKLAISLTLSIALTTSYTYGLAISSPKPKSSSCTHIIKLKSSSIANATSFEPSAFINSHYTTFKNGNNRRTIQYTDLDQSTTEGSNAHSLSAASLSQPLSTASVKNVGMGQHFKAIVGSFDSAFATYLSQLDDIEYIEPNQVYKASILPPTSAPRPYIADSSDGTSPTTLNDSTISVSQLQKRNIITQTNVPSWGLARINHRDLKNLSTYSVDEAAGDDIHVYVLDSGINTNHPDIKGRAFLDANYVDYEEDDDLAGHGTHVAGTIGGNLFGVAKKAILHSVKILDANGDGTTSNLIEAVSYIVQVAKPGRSLINLSLTGPRSKSIDEVLSMAVREHNIPVFVSAGNTGDNACEYSPPANPDVFAVGASNQNDMIPHFSSYGDCVRIYAPGTNITSSWLGQNSQSMDGTSMANPHVTGIAAMLMSQHTYSTPHQLYDAIVSLATHNVLKAVNVAKNGSPKALAYNGFERP